MKSEGSGWVKPAWKDGSAQGSEQAPRH
jgi:hypothetical protein